MAENFVHFFVTSAYPPSREELARALVLRGAPADWAQSQWSGGSVDREKERAEDSCYGFGDGFFEWVLPLGSADLRKAHRLRVLCGRSSHHAGSRRSQHPGRS